MKINIFVGIEGTHTLIDNMIGGTSVALPNNNKVPPQLALDNILLVTGPVIKYPFQKPEPLEAVLPGSFIIDDTKTICNLGFFGFLNLTAETIAKASTGSRLWFFRPVDTLITAKCLMDMSEKSIEAGNPRIIEQYGDAITTIEQSKIIVDDRIDELIDQAITNLSGLRCVHEWQPFNAELFNGGDAPLTSNIEAICWEITS
jgi:hypothetical protein